MKYYAVTEDPNELFHYGVKGMKWGKHLFGDEPKSPGYKRAASKLRASLKSNASKAKAGWKSVSSTLGEKMRKRQETKFENAVKAAQDRVKKNELLFAKNEIKQQEKASKQAYKDLIRSQKESAREAKDIQKYRNQIGKIQRMAELSDFKASMKQDSKASKAEKHMDKYMQEAREGRLKYGKLTDEQVERVTERLALENQARRLGNTERPKFRKEMKAALRRGILEGITSGTATAMTEVARAKVQTKLKNKGALMKQAKQQAKIQKEQNRIRNKKTHHEAKEDLKQELYEQQIRSGEGAIYRTFHGKTAAGIGKQLQKLDTQKHERYRLQNAKDEVQSNFDKQYYQLLQNTGDASVEQTHRRPRVKYDAENRALRNEYVRNHLAEAYNNYAEQQAQKEENDLFRSTDSGKKMVDTWALQKAQYDKDMAAFEDEQRRVAADEDRYAREKEEYDNKAYYITQMHTMLPKNQLDLIIKSKLGNEPLPAIKPTLTRPTLPQKPKITNTLARPQDFGIWNLQRNLGLPLITPPSNKRKK